MPNDTVRAAAIGLPAAPPEPETFITVRLSRTMLELLHGAIEDLLLLSDELTGDADLEDDTLEGEHDGREGSLLGMDDELEPSLGWAEGGENVAWAALSPGRARCSPVDDDLEEDVGCEGEAHADDDVEEDRAVGPLRSSPADRAIADELAGQVLPRKRAIDDRNAPSAFRS